jgi:outer membrane protein assembly factor BamD
MGRIALLALLVLVLPGWTQPSGTNLPLRDDVEIAQKSADEIADPDADKTMVVARYYISRGDYTAALNRLKVLLTTFQTSRYVDEALARLTDVYLKLGIASEAQTAAAVLARKFPNSRWSTYAGDALRSAGLEPVEHGGSWPPGDYWRPGDGLPGR